MESKGNEIQVIREKFAKMQTKEDFVDLLNFTKPFVYVIQSKPYSLKAVNYFANPKFCNNRYKRFKIKKKSGGTRLIHSPTKGLKSILRVLNFILQVIDEPNSAATGFVPKKSIVDNAKKHVGKYYVFNADIKDFFHSFDRNRVKLAFMYGNFGLKDREEIAFLMASLCTHPFEIDGERRIVLPQGAPTSPTITNIICKRLDRRLTGLAKRFGAYYTRYADDITFSSYLSIFGKTDGIVLNEKGSYDNFILEFERLIDEEKLILNRAKTRMQKHDYRQEVTGLTVNDKVNVSVRYVKQLRMWLYYWERYGYSHAAELFRKDYIKDKGHIKSGKENFKNVLKGKLLYLRMVKGEDDSTYKKLRKRFDKLRRADEPVQTVLNIWEQDGVEVAMKYYYKRFNTKPVRKPDNKRR